MSARDRKLLMIAVLFTVAGGSIYWQFFGGAVSVANNGAGPTATVIPPPDRINVQSMGASEAIAGAERNPFGFGREVVKAPPPPEVIIQAPPPPITAPPPQPPRNIQPTTTVATAPNVPLNYTGYARDDANEMVAFLDTPGATNIPAGHYNLREEDYLLGRFRIIKITPDSVEVEDLESAENTSNRKRTININAAIAVRR